MLFAFYFLKAVQCFKIFSFRLDHENNEIDIDHKSINHIRRKVVGDHRLHTKDKKTLLAFIMSITSYVFPHNCILRSPVIATILGE